MFEATELALPGLFLVKAPRHADYRGYLTKIFHKPSFDERGFTAAFTESYYSVSHLNVLRGLHFQIPPYDHDKCVTCITGQAQDVVLDLRRSSATYGRHVVIPLSSEDPTMVFIPRGMAHGFLSLAENTMLFYNVTSVFEPTADRGILWNSAGIEWQAASPVISERDMAFPALADFESPF